MLQKLANFVEDYEVVLENSSYTAMETIVRQAEGGKLCYHLLKFLLFKLLNMTI